MDLISLYYFQELSKDLNMTKTAERLYISQQTLSNHIQRLEQYYGTKLFYRKPSLSLTCAGEFVLSFAQVVGKEERNLKDILSDVEHQERGTLRFGASMARGSQFLPIILPAFQRRYPRVEVRFVEGLSAKLEKQVANGEVDFAVVLSDRYNADLVEHEFLREEVYLCVPEVLLRQDDQPPGRTDSGAVSSGGSGALGIFHRPLHRTDPAPVRVRDGRLLQHQSVPGGAAGADGGAGEHFSSYGPGRAHGAAALPAAPPAAVPDPFRQVFYGAAVRLHRRAGPDSRPPGGRRRGSCGKKCGKCVNRRRKRGEETGKIEETPEISRQKIVRDSGWRFEGICGIIKRQSAAGAEILRRRQNGSPGASPGRNEAKTSMIDLILLAEGPKELDGGKLLAEEEGKPLYLHAFQAARQTADAMLGLRVIVVTRPGVLDEAIRAFGFNKVVVSGCRSLSEAIVAGTKAARSGASRCFLSCGRREVTGEQLTAFLQGYILSGRPLGRMSSAGGGAGAMVFAPYLLPQLLALKGEEDGSQLFAGREGRTFSYDGSGREAAGPEKAE